MCYFICCEIDLGYVERNKTITSDLTTVCYLFLLVRKQNENEKGRGLFIVMFCFFQLSEVSTNSQELACLVLSTTSFHFHVTSISSTTNVTYRADLDSHKDYCKTRRNKLCEFCILTEKKLWPKQFWQRNIEKL